MSNNSENYCNPIRATWSSLQCLATLSPPSPLCSPDKFGCRDYTGEIPIFFDSGIEIPDSPDVSKSPVPELPESPASDVTLSTRLELDLSTTSKRTSINTFGCLRSPLPSSRSIASANNSVNQFRLAGSPSTSNSEQGSPFFPRNSLEMMYFSPSLVANSSPILPAVSLNHQRLSAQAPQYDTRPGGGSSLFIPCFTPSLLQGGDGDACDLEGWDSPQTISSYATAQTEMAPSDSYASGLSFLSFDSRPPSIQLDSIYEAGADMRSYLEIEDEDQHTIRPTPRPQSTYTTSTIGFAHLSPSPSDISLMFPIPPQGPHRRIARKDAIHRRRDSAQSSHRSRPSRELSVSSPPQTRTRLPAKTELLLPPALSSLPSSLSWLSKVRIELLIDQEGFRLIRPAFVLSAYHDVPGEPAVAEFRPVVHSTHHFHHSTLDPDPVLRRIIAGDDEEHDYVTRNAALTIKAPGVYAVNGIESMTSGARAIAGQATGGEASRKLPWRLVYAITERISEQTGVAVPGERAFTPVGFACAPMLLHPSNAHRVSLFQLAKKAARPKLVPKRLGPARMPAVNPAVERENLPPPEAGPQHPLRVGPWDDHERALSGASTDNGKDEDERCLIRRSVRPDAVSPYEQWPTPCNVQRPFVAAGVRDTRAQRVLAPAATHNRNILPTVELNKLVSGSSVGEDGHKTIDFGGLAPPPSHSLTNRLSARTGAL